jgi:hypothetical protein
MTSHRPYFYRNMKTGIFDELDCPLKACHAAHAKRNKKEVVIFMRSSLRVLLLSGLLAVIAGCAGSKPGVYQAEKFDSTDTFTRRFPVSSEVACEAVRRTLLSQGYVISAASNNQIDGRKSFQPQSDVHMQIAFRVVCATDAANGAMSSVFVNALEDRYALKKTNNSASLGVGALGSLSLPFSSSDDSLVKVASETISSENFYTRFFQLVERYLANEDVPLSDTIEMPDKSFRKPLKSVMEN